MIYLKDALGYCIPSIALVLFWLGGRILLTKKKLSLPTWAFAILLGMYLIVVFSVTVSPMYGYRTTPQLETVNLIPFAVLRSGMNNPLNLYGNILMFLPMGFFPVFLSKSFQKLHQTLFLGFSVSFLIELLQLFLGRGTDIDDIILNSIGTVIGFLVAKAMITLQTQKKESRISQGIFSKKELVHYVFFLLCCVLLIGSVKRRSYLSPSASAEQTFPLTVDSSSTIQTADRLTASKNTLTPGHSLKAENVCLLDGKNLSIVYGENPEEEIAPASTTKMMTALIVMDYCDLEETVTVGKEMKEIAADASTADLWEGDVLSVENLLYAMLLPSGNDASYTLAVHTGKAIAGEDTISQDEAIRLFVEKMNQKASAIGANHTHFVRPDGYDATGQYSSAYDLTLIASKLLQNPTLSQIVSTETKRCLFENGRDVTYYNTNEMLDENSDYYDANVIGIKTGGSGQAGKCLVSGANIHGHLYLCAIMGDSEEGRFEDTRALYEQLEKN